MKLSNRILQMCIVGNAFAYLCNNKLHVNAICIESVQVGNYRHSCLVAICLRCNLGGWNSDIGDATFFTTIIKTP